MASIREKINEEYGILVWVQRSLKELGADQRKSQDLIRRYRDRIAELEREVEDPLAKPITEGWRHGYVYEGEGGYDYIIIDDNGETDDELSEWFDCCVAYPPICSPYDCTGKRFTWFKHINRTPAGIVVVHRWSRDI